MVADVEGRVVEMDVGFDGGTSDRDGGEEGKCVPVVIVGVDSFLSESFMLARTLKKVVYEGGWWTGLRELTGWIPCVKDVGYVYALLRCVLSRILCSAGESSGLLSEAELKASKHAAIDVVEAFIAESDGSSDGR